MMTLFVPVAALGYDCANKRFTPSKSSSTAETSTQPGGCTLAIAIQRLASFSRPTWTDAKQPDHRCEGSATDRGRHEEGRFNPWSGPEYDKPYQETWNGTNGRRWQRGCIELPRGPSCDGQGQKKRWTSHNRPPKPEKAGHHRRRPSDLYRTAPARSRENGQALLAKVDYEPGEHRCRTERVGGGVVSEQGGQQNTAIRRAPAGPKQKSLTHSGLAVGTRGRPPSGDYYSCGQVTRLCIAKGRGLSTGGASG